jgi:hypothetical protein
MRHDPGPAVMDDEVVLPDMVVINIGQPLEITLTMMLCMSDVAIGKVIFDVGCLRGHLVHRRRGSVFDPSEVGSYRHQYVRPAGRERGRLAMRWR